MGSGPKLFRLARVHCIAPAPYVQQHLLGHEIAIYCDCELPEVFDNMIECDGCDR